MYKENTHFWAKERRYSTGIYIGKIWARHKIKERVLYIGNIPIEKIQCFYIYIGILSGENLKRKSVYFLYI